jgi:hypothetical protein
MNRKMDDGHSRQRERLSEVPPPPGGETPPWSDPAPRHDGGREHQCLEFCPICRTADVIRAALPPEAREHWQSFQREGLLAARAMLDHYIHHLDAQSARDAPVEDIPIE